MCNTHTKAKKYANNVVKNTEDVPNGSAYKKITCSYDINDGGIAKPIPKGPEKWKKKARRK